MPKGPLPPAPGRRAAGDTDLDRRRLTDLLRLRRLSLSDFRSLSALPSPLRSFSRLPLRLPSPFLSLSLSLVRSPRLDLPSLPSRLRFPSRSRLPVRSPLSRSLLCRCSLPFLSFSLGSPSVTFASAAADLLASFAGALVVSACAACTVSTALCFGCSAAASTEAAAPAT